MAEGVLSGITVEILKKVGLPAVHEIASAWGFKSDLDKLKATINTVKAFLLDAEEKQADNHAVRDWLIRLTDVVYAADDLFDEFATVASRKQLLAGNKFIKELRAFVSGDNQIAYALSFSRKIKSIRKELKGVIQEGNGLGLVQKSYEEGRVITWRRDQSYSFVDADEIIGRDADKSAVLDLLLASSSSDDHEHASSSVDDEHERRVLPVVCIVGIGGMGKTALAQLIYNDPLVQDFFELRLWVCVSDVFDVREIIEKILKSATNSETPKLEMDQLQGMLRNEIRDKKFLLVLDDVWNEDREKWLKMKALLQVGRKGSRILVTTRSNIVVKKMGAFSRELQGLSEEKSWDLFEKMAFEPGEAQMLPSLVEIGKEIVQKCAGLPLAIRTLGGLLYGQDERKWLELKNKSLANISDDENKIMNILKISYHHLGSPLKNCFAYCTLFPKDYNFSKEMLINLWMAEGFIIPTANESRSLEELGEDYFLTLLQRGFFQDAKRDEQGCIRSCKMHDCMHDLSQLVAGVKCKVVNPDEYHYQGKIRHLSIAYRLNFENIIPPAILDMKLSRTLLLPQQLSDGSIFSTKICQKIISSFSCLRVLDLHGLGLTKLPSSIGNLIHLRYLDLSLNPIEALPASVTQLNNLQTLDLNSCFKIKTLPAKITKLINLQSLDVSDCLELSEMPSGIGELKLLHKLPLFIATLEKSSKLGTKSTRSAKLGDLKKLNNLRGKLKIDLKKGTVTDLMLEVAEETLTRKDGLTDLEIAFGENDKVLECLKPHKNLRKLTIQWYWGLKLPSWAMKDHLLNILPNLVEIHFDRLRHCQKLPNFSELPLLKCLILALIYEVEYMEVENGVNEASSSLESTLFFPSLELLKLECMMELKGIGQPAELLSLSFPKLSNLTIIDCPNLTSFPNCPNVEKLHLVKTSKRLSVLEMATTGSSKLKELTIDNVDVLVFIPKQCLLQLSSLTIHGNSSLVSTDKLGEVSATFASSLRSLKFISCKELKAIHKGLEHLTSLEEFVLSGTNWSCEYEYKEMPWKAFKSSLRTLRLHCCDNLIRLPRGVQHLTNLRTLEFYRYTFFFEIPEWISCLSSLQFLELRSCPRLESLPDGLRKLTSLQELRIIGCDRLRERCSPNGKDRPKIRHIPLIVVI